MEREGRGRAVRKRKYERREGAREGKRERKRKCERREGDKGRVGGERGERKSSEGQG